MSTDPFPNDIAASESLAPITELQSYGATIIAELDEAEAQLSDPTNQPFSAMSADVMSDVAKLRAAQFDMFRRHVEIEHAYKIENAVGDGNDVQRMSFSGIAKTMRKKERATAGLLNRLADFDSQVRTVIDKFETVPASTTTPTSAATASSPSATTHSAAPPSSSHTPPR